MPSSKTALRIAAPLLAVTATAIWLWLPERPADPGVPGKAAQASQTEAPKESPVTAVQEQGHASGSDAQLMAAEALVSSPEFLEFEQDQAFRQRVRDFFEDQQISPSPSRQSQARALDQEIVDAQTENRVSAAEALLLRMALIQRSEPDSEQRQNRLSQLVEQYRQQAEQHSAAPSDDPRFRDYKQQEQAIVQEVMAMKSIPNGMDRNEYLRLRLQNAREQRDDISDSLNR